MRQLKYSIFFVLVALLQFADAAPADDVTFVDISAILVQRCVMCHSGPAAPRGLRLDSMQALIAGSERGPVIKAGDPAASELVRRLRGTSTPRMPMTGPPFLSEPEIALFEDWIANDMPAGPDGPGETELGPATGQQAAAAITEDAPPIFDQVAVIFATRCAKCHTDNGLMTAAPEGYRLTSYAAAVSAKGRARIVPGNPAASELIRRIRGQALPRMPFDGPPYLDDAEISLLERWVAEGARNAEGVAAPIPVGSRVRLHGQLTQQWRFDDLPLNVTSSTRLDKHPQPGDRVRVRGHLQADGSIRVDRISVRH